MVAINPFIGIRPAITRNEVTYCDTCSSFDRARAIKKQLDNAEVVKDDGVGYYIYRIEDPKVGVTTGLVALVSLNLFDGNSIRSHENTIEAKECQYIASFLEAQLQINPVLLVHSHRAKIYSLLLSISENSKPDLLLNRADVFHSLWRISNWRTIKKISQIYQNVDCLYVADGHHRIGALRRANKKNSIFCNQLLSMLVSERDINICSISRGIKELRGLDTSKFFSQLGKYFTIIDTIATKTLHKYKYQMFFGNKWFSLSLKNEIVGDLKGIEALDPMVVQRYFFESVLEIYYQCKSDNIVFLPDYFSHSYLEDWVVKKNIGLLICLPKLDIKDFFWIADNAYYLPPHSTYFMPKPLDGLVSVALSTNKKTTLKGVPYRHCCKKHHD